MVKSSIKIAVTGGVASGKSTVCFFFKNLGMVVFSADQFAREVVEKGTDVYNKIIEHFGKQILKNDGNINRQLLRDLITQNNENRIFLEKIVHPEIIMLMKAKLDDAQKNGQIIVMEVPLLFELGLEKLFDVTVMVYSKKEAKIRRIQTRDNVTAEKAGAFIGLQMSDEKKIEASDFMIYNNNSKEHLEKDVKKLYEKILRKKKWNRGA